MAACTATAPAVSARAAARRERTMVEYLSDAVERGRQAVVQASTGEMSLMIVVEVVERLQKVQVPSEGLCWFSERVVGYGRASTKTLIRREEPGRRICKVSRQERMFVSERLHLGQTAIEEQGESQSARAFKSRK